MNKYIISIIILILLSSSYAVADQFTEEQQSISTAEMLQQSTVVIQNGLKQGTGFYISPTQIITNNHVVSSGLMWVKKKNGEPCLALVEKTDIESDLSLITACESGTPLKLATTVKLGQSVLVMGHPIKQEFFLSKGIVSSLGDYLLTDAFSAQGNSGGPVVNLSGDLVGVMVAGVKGVDKMSVAIPVKTLNEFMEGAK